VHSFLARVRACARARGRARIVVELGESVGVVGLVRGGRAHPERGMQPSAVVEALDVVEDRRSQRGPGGPAPGGCWWSSTSLVSVAKNVSATALSKQSPRLPIERAMPCCTHVLPNASETNWADSSGRRNAPSRGVAMGARRRRRSDRAGRPAMLAGASAAGRKEHRQRFWAAIARGLSSEDAAAQAGVSAPVGVRWFREGAGCRRSPWARRRGDT
jgi:hypothetical protein